MPLITGGPVPLHVADDDFIRPWRPHEAVVMQHGFCRNGGFWAPWVPYLGRFHRVLRPDLRGCGRSGDPGPDCAVTMADYVGDLFRVLDQLGIENAHYVGEATGAFIGMAAAAKDPGRIRSLNVFNTPMGATASTQQVYAMGNESWAAAIRQLGVEGWWRQAGAAEAAARQGGHPGDARRLGGEAPDDVAAAYDHYAREAGKTPVHVAIAMLTLGSSLDVPELLDGVAVPMRFLTSSRYSFNTSREQLESLARRVPGSMIKEFDVRNRSGLFCFFEAETIAPDVMQFLQAVDLGDAFR